jgi:predicted nuclease with TOPRIM domain
VVVTVKNIILVCDAVQSGRNLTTVLRNLIRPSSGRVSRSKYDKGVNIHD